MVICLTALVWQDATAFGGYSSVFQEEYALAKLPANDLGSQKSDCIKKITPQIQLRKPLIEHDLGRFCELP